MLLVVAARPAEPHLARNDGERLRRNTIFANVHVSCVGAGGEPEMLGPRLMGYFQLGLLCLMIFLYVGFRIYYARKYGEWETDEE